MFDEVENLEDNVYLNMKDVKTPSEFIACLGTFSDFSKFQNLFKNLNEWCLSSSLTKAKTKNDLYLDQSVLVKHKIEDDDDQLWKRAKVTQIDDPLVSVLLIDEGFVIRLPITDIVTNLPSYFSDLVGQAKRCKLNNAVPKGSAWTEKENEYFKKIINENGLALTFISKNPISDSSSVFTQEYDIEVYYLKNKEKILDVLVKEGHAKASSFSNYRECQIEKDLGENIIIDSVEAIEISSEDEISTEKNATLRSPKRERTLNLESEDDVIECAEEKIDNIIWLGESKRNHNDKQVSQLRQSNQDMRSSNQRINKQRKSNHYNKAHDDSNLFDYFQENINIPLLVGQDYSKYSIKICSDDTIATGYRPNVVVNAAEISRQIKETNLNNLNRLQSTSQLKVDTNKKLAQAGSKKNEEKIYEILSGTNGAYKDLTAKYNAITKIYMENPRSNLMPILKCFFREMKNSAISISEALDLMKKLKFCTEQYFTKAFDEIFNENKPNELDQDMIIIGDLNRQSFCFYLANIYKTACNTNNYDFLKSIPFRCSQIITDWIEIKNVHEITSVSVAKLRCIYDFLSLCLDDFKAHHFDTFNLVLEKSMEYVSDFTIKREIIAESNRIICLYAIAYKNTRTVKRNVNCESSSLSSSDNQIRFYNPPNDNKQNFRRRQKRKSNENPSFLEPFTRREDS